MACAVATPGRIEVLEGLWQQRKQIEADIAAEDGAQKRKQIGVRKPEANRTGTGYRERPMAVGSSVSASIAAATAPAAAAGAKRKRSPPAAAMDSWLVSAFTTVVVSWGVHIAMFIHHFALSRWALYRRKVGPDDECVVDVCGSRSTTAFVAENGREAAGALTLGAVRERMAVCCCTQANAPSLEQLAAVWRAYAACATRLEQDRVIGRDDARLFAKLYDSSITALRRRPCGECAAELYCCSKRRVTRLWRIADACSAAGLPALDADFRVTDATIQDFVPKMGLPMLREAVRHFSTWTAPANLGLSGDPGHRRVVDDKLSSVKKWWEAFKDATGAGLSLSTYRRWFPRLKSAAGVTKLYEAGQDHNFCPMCKYLMDAFRRKHVLVGALPPGPDQVQAKIDRATVSRAVDAHKARDIALRAYRHAWVGLGIKSREAGNDAVHVAHLDDAAPVQLPNNPLDTGMRSRYRYGVHGQAMEVSGRCSVLLSELGMGSKDANLFTNFALINALTEVPKANFARHDMSDKQQTLFLDIPAADEPLGCDVEAAAGGGGIRVVTVAAGGAGDKAGFLTGDRIVSVGQEHVDGAVDFGAAVNCLVNGRRGGATVCVERDATRPGNVFILYLDNAAIQKNGGVCVGLPQLLVDLKLCTFCILIFGAQHHCKGLADALFSWVCGVFKCVVLGLNRLGQEIAKITNVGDAPVTARRVLPAAMNRWSKTLAARYDLTFKGDDAACSVEHRFSLNELDPHIICAGDPADLDKLPQQQLSAAHAWQTDSRETTSVREMVAAIVGPGKGWVRMHTAPGCAAPPFDYYAPKLGATHVAPGNRGFAAGSAAGDEHGGLGSDHSQINATTVAATGHCGRNWAATMGTALDIATSDELPRGAGDDPRHHGANAVTVACRADHDAYKLPTEEFAEVAYGSRKECEQWPPDWEGPLPASRGTQFEAELQSLAVSTRGNTGTQQTVAGVLEHVCSTTSGLQTLASSVIGAEAPAVERHVRQCRELADTQAARKVRDKAVAKRSAFCVAKEQSLVGGAVAAARWRKGPGGACVAWADWKLWFNGQRDSNSQLFAGWSKAATESALTHYDACVRALARECELASKLSPFYWSGQKKQEREERRQERDVCLRDPFYWSNFNAQRMRI